MYLASKKINDQIHYLIRESYPREDFFLSRDLIDLGTDPASHIIYPGGNAFNHVLAEIGAQIDSNVICPVGRVIEFIVDA